MDIADLVIRNYRLKAEWVENETKYEIVNEVKKAENQKWTKQIIITYQKYCFIPNLV